MLQCAAEFCLVLGSVATHWHHQEHQAKLKCCYALQSSALTWAVCQHNDTIKNTTKAKLECCYALQSSALSWTVWQQLTQSRSPPKQIILLCAAEFCLDLRCVAAHWHHKEHRQGKTEMLLFAAEFCRLGLGCVTPYKLQALVYDILPSTTAVFSYAIGSRRLSANEQFFVGAQTVASLLQTQIKQGVSFITANKV